MNCRKAFKTLILPQLSDSRSLQGCSKLVFASRMGPQHSELHYSQSHVGRPHCEKSRSATFKIFLYGGSATLLLL